VSQLVLLLFIGNGALMATTQSDKQVAAVRPVPFSEDAVVFELRDGRVSKQDAGHAAPPLLPAASPESLVLGGGGAGDLQGDEWMLTGALIFFLWRAVGGAAACGGGGRRVGVGADHRHAGQRLHDQLLDGRRHVAGGWKRKRGAGTLFVVWRE
jgi:hypothetical protein